VFVHALTANATTVERPSLPGPAALVERVLPLGEVVGLLGEAGFAGLRIGKHGDQPCFVVGAAELRETKVTASAPAASGGAGGCCS
jgi:hypothetical protein